jgi:transposase-like protein
MKAKPILNLIWQELFGLDGEGRKARISELARRYQKHPNTIHRWAKEAGMRRRKERQDKGTTKIPEASLMMASTLQATSKRLSNQVILPACDAKEILEDSGLLTTDISDGWFNAKLREKKISAKHLCQPSPHVNLLSDHPNHVWQFDVTNCIQYFLDDKGLGSRDLELELEKNKIIKAAKKIKKELLRYVVVDHCTGAFYMHYFYATGEKEEDGQHFLLKAMRPKDELIERTFNGCSESKKGKYHFHGVPFILYTDKGSIARAKKMKNLLEALRVELITHLPGNPRAKGMVECHMKIINRFEAKLSLQRPADLEQLNAWALDWCIRFNGIKDMRGVAPRSALWSKIRQEQLRLCPDEKTFWRLVSTDAIERKVNGALLIFYEGRTYRLPDPNLAYQKVLIRKNAFESPAIDVCGNGYTWLLKPIEKDEYGRLTDGVRFGEYKSLKHTETQKAKTEIEEIAQGWGLTWKGTGDKRRAEAPPVGHESPLQVFGHQADKVKVDFISRKGVELEIKQAETPENKPLEVSAFEVSRDISARRIPFTEFLKRLIAEVGPISKELNQQLRAEYGESIEISKAEQLIANSIEHRAKSNEKKAAEM